MTAGLCNIDGKGLAHAPDSEAQQVCIAEDRKEIAAYKRFKKLMKEWIDLSIERSNSRMKVDKKTGYRVG